MFLAALAFSPPQPAVSRIALAPCNPDPLKGAAWHAHVQRDEDLASAAD